MAAYFYILRCADRRHYYGITSDLMQRLRQHQKGHVLSTRTRRPVELVYFDTHETLHQARQKERSFKNHGVRAKALAELISRFPQQRLALFAAAARPG